MAPRSPFPMLLICKGTARFESGVGEVTTYPSCPEMLFTQAWTDSRVDFSTWVTTRTQRGRQGQGTHHIHPTLPPVTHFCGLSISESLVSDSETRA